MSKRDSEDELDDLFDEDAKKIDQMKTNRSNSRGPRQNSANRGRTTRTTVGNKDRSSTLSRGRATQSGRKTDFQDSRLSEQARKLIVMIKKIDFVTFKRI